MEPQFILQFEFFLIFFGIKAIVDYDALYPTGYDKVRFIDKKEEN